MGLSADTVKANAMLAGLGRTRRVLMGDTLLEKFSPDEIEVIFAHEIGHHVHRHIPKMIAAGVVFSVVGFWLLDRLLVWWAGIPTAAERPTSSLPLVMFVMSVFGLLLSPLQNVISRHYERQCDRYALSGPATATPTAWRFKNWPASIKTTPRRTRWKSFCCTRIRRLRSGWRWRIERRGVQEFGSSVDRVRVGMRICPGFWKS